MSRKQYNNFLSSFIIFEEYDFHEKKRDRECQCHYHER